MCLYTHHFQSLFLFFLVLLIYEYLNNRELKLLDMHQINREECMKVFEEYTNNNGTIY